MKYTRYEITRDERQWILRAFYQGKDRHGEPKEQYRETYYPSLRWMGSHMVDMELIGEFDLDKILEAQTAVLDRIESALTVCTNEREFTRPSNKREKANG